MNELLSQLKKIFGDSPSKIVLSKPAVSTEYRRVCFVKKGNGYQLEKYTDKQVFHENLSGEDALRRCGELLPENFHQLNARGLTCEFGLSISKKGKILFNEKRIANQTEQAQKPSEISHNRKKNYIIAEDKPFPALIDMGVFTKEGKVAKPMYDKFRQINRFAEIIDDALKERDYSGRKLKIIDFGCGKSYLTFVLYHYFTEIRGLDTDMLGLDLKADVIEKCNAAAERYGYKNLRFETGDISSASAQGNADIVVTLHACDTATDYALYNA